MSNRGVRGVRTVGPGSARQSGLEPAKRRSAPGSNGMGHDDQRVAASEAVSVDGTQTGPTDVTAEHLETDTESVGRAPTGRLPLRQRRWPLRVATGVAVLGVAGTIGFGIGYFNLNGKQADVSAAKKQAQNYIIALTNFDPKGLDNEINKIESYATGNFKTSISQFFSKDVRNTLLKNNSESRGEVRSIYPQSSGGDHVSFFAVVDDTIANNQLSAPASDEIDMTVDMVNTSQGWRVANNTFLQSPLFSPTQSGSGGSGSPAPSPAAPGH